MWPYTDSRLKGLIIFTIKNMKRKRKLLPKKWRDLWMKGTYNHTEAKLKWFGNHRCLTRSESSTLSLFWSRKTSVIVQIFQLNFCVLFFWRSFIFSKIILILLLYFVLSILWYFPLHVISIHNNKLHSLTIHII